MYAKPLLISAIVFSLVFLAFPGIDLWVNGLFYNPVSGFLLKGNAFFDFLRKSVPVIVWASLLASLTVLLSGRFGIIPPALKPWRRAALFLALVLLLGPGVLVNGVFKDHWGRARPAQVTEFGGTAQFTPAWVVSDQCQNNCSFVCGDASVGFAFVALAFVSRRPKTWLGVGLAIGGLFGFMRMGQGGHFFSDVIFSFYAVYFTAWLLHWWMTRKGQPLIAAASP